jgi:hypothetical protein
MTTFSPWPPSRTLVALGFVLLAVLACGRTTRIVDEAARVVVRPLGETRPGHQDLSCRHCHGGDLEGLWRQIPGADEGARHAMSLRCAACHEALKLHHPQQADRPACLDCHSREHRGREAFYHVPDSTCTNCHEEPHRADDQPSLLEGVGGLARHPEFAALRVGRHSDPVRLWFPHDIHVRDGLPTREGTKVTLTCTTCHQSDKVGRHFFPVNYERHCMECHTLGVRLPAVLNGPGWEALAQRFRNEAAPHRPPALVLDALTARLAADAGRYPGLSRAWPAGGTEREGPDPDPATWPRRAARVVAEPLLSGFGGCRVCHLLAGEHEGLPAFERTGMRNHWLPAASFDHAPHTNRVDCGRCHSASTSHEARDILIPGINDCRACHGAPTSQPLAAPGTCVTCHAYHAEGKRRTEDQALWQGLPPHP